MTVAFRNITPPFAQISRAFFKDRRLKPTDILVYGYMATWIDVKTNTAWCTINMISAELKIHRSKVTASLRHLETLGYLKRVGKTPHRSKVYLFLEPMSHASKSGASYVPDSGTYDAESGEPYVPESGTLVIQDVIQGEIQLQPRSSSPPSKSKTPTRCNPKTLIYPLSLPTTSLPAVKEVVSELPPNVAQDIIDELAGSMAIKEITSHAGYVHKLKMLWQQNGTFIMSNGAAVAEGRKRSATQLAAKQKRKAEEDQKRLDQINRDAAITKTMSGLSDKELARLKQNYFEGLESNSIQRELLGNRVENISTNNTLFRLFVAKQYGV